MKHTIEGRHYYKGPGRPKKTLTIAPGTDPHIRQVLQAVIDSGLTWNELAADAGIDASTIRYWFYYSKIRDQRFRIVKAIAAAVGLELTFVPAPRRIAADGYALADDQ